MSMADICIRRAALADAEYIGKNLRQADVEEILALGEDPERMVRYCVLAADDAFTGEVNGVPAMVFGCVQPMTSEWAEIFALGTDACTGVPREMLCFGREVVSTLLQKYPRMMNYCDARYVQALKWLKMIGFTVYPPEPYGPKGMPFCRIEIEKKEEA